MKHPAKGGMCTPDMDFFQKTVSSPKLDAEGVAFVGPPVGAIEKMGDKITSKKIAQEAGVSTVPGYMGLIEGVKPFISQEIGYP